MMMAILVNTRMDTQIHYQVLLRDEIKMDTRRRFSLTLSRFINNLLWSKLKSYGLQRQI